MKIVAIFARKLYAVQYKGEIYNEYDRLMELWTDVSYLRAYAKQNKLDDIANFVNETIAHTNYISKLMAKVQYENLSLNTFFRPLDDLETRKKMLSLQKGKQHRLRIYAIKVDDDLFVITGGAIKLVHKMQEHPDTLNEKYKLEQVQTYLKRAGIFDDASFYELLNEDEL